MPSLVHFWTFVHCCKCDHYDHFRHH